MARITLKIESTSQDLANATASLIKDAAAKIMKGGRAASEAAQDLHSPVARAGIYSFAAMLRSAGKSETFAAFLRKLTDAVESSAPVELPEICWSLGSLVGSLSDAQTKRLSSVLSPDAILRLDHAELTESATVCTTELVAIRSELLALPKSSLQTLIAGITDEQRDLVHKIADMLPSVARSNDADGSAPLH